MPRDALPRTCCDGRCTRGHGCPAFAPGVIDGPYKPRTWLSRLWAWILGEGA